jgi:hypothetical protein
MVECFDIPVLTTCDEAFLIIVREPVNVAIVA